MTNFLVTGELPTPKMEPEAGNLDIVAIPFLQDDSIDVVGIARDSSCLVSNNQTKTLPRCLLCFLYY